MWFYDEGLKWFLELLQRCYSPFPHLWLDVSLTWHTQTSSLNIAVKGQEWTSLICEEERMMHLYMTVSSVTMGHMDLYFLYSRNCSPGRTEVSSCWIISIRCKRTTHYQKRHTSSNSLYFFTCHFSCNSNFYSKWMVCSISILHLSLVKFRQARLPLSFFCSKQAFPAYFLKEMTSTSSSFCFTSCRNDIKPPDLQPGLQDQ